MNYTLYKGIVERGYQMASGWAKKNPFGDSTIRLQMPHFAARGFDLAQQVPNFFLGTVNVNIDPLELKLVKPDHTIEFLNWTDVIPPETFSFVKCTLVHKDNYYAGLLYYPHPETKPNTNAHHYNRLEVLTTPVTDLQYGDDVAVLCRADAFEEFS